MSTPLFMEERRRIILEQLRKSGRVSVKGLSEILSVSEVTIRQDLRALESEGQLERTHGGAVSVDPSKRQTEQAELSFDVRRTKQYDEKDVIGRTAASLVKAGDAIALDASTTVVHILPYLKNLDSLTIVTNNLMVAELLLKTPRIQVLLPGGRLRRDSYSIVGNPASLPDINLKIGFFSAWGITPETGLTEVSEAEMLMKQAIISRCVSKIALIDSTKWGQMAPYTYAMPHEVSQIITTDRTSASMIKQIRGVKIRTVPCEA